MSLGFVVSALLAGFLIPKILLIAFRKNLFDVPDERKIHHMAVPRLGGLAFVPTLIFAFSLVLGIDLLSNQVYVLHVFGRSINQLIFSLCALLLLYLVGVADDLIGVRYRAKFMVQVLCSGLIVTSGLYINNLHGLFGIHEIPYWVGVLVTVLVVVFITNAINLIDGLDGLASGLCAVGLAFYGVLFYYFGYYPFALIAFSMLGVIVPFFMYNVFGKPEKSQKIFMGDTGSLTLGFILSILCIKILSTQPMWGLYRTNPVILAAAPLLIPCLDVVRVFFHRIINGSNPFLPDKSHIHHKLMQLGLKPYSAMITIIASALIIGSIDILVSPYINVTLLTIINFVLYLGINYLLSYIYYRKKARNKF